MLNTRAVCAVVVFLAVTGLSVTAARAAVIYADDFDGGNAFLQGKAPDVRHGGETWQANDNGRFRADGRVVAGGKQDAVLLPFTPRAGNVYTLSATVDTTAGGSDWIALGFCEKKRNVNFSDTSFGYGWILIRKNRGAEGSQTFTGSGGRGVEAAAATGGGQEIRIVLDAADAEPSNWTVAWFLNGDRIRAATKAAAGDYGKIAYVGFSRYAAAAGTIDDFRLETTAGTGTSRGIALPEPVPEQSLADGIKKAGNGAIAFLFSQQQPDGSIVDPNRKGPVHGFHKERKKTVLGPGDKDSNPKWNNPRQRMILQGGPNARNMQYETKKAAVFSTCVAVQALLEAGVDPGDGRIRTALNYLQKYETMHTIGIAARARLRILLGKLAGAPRKYYSWFWRDLQRLAAARNGTDLSGGWGEGIWSTDSHNHVTAIVTEAFACAQRNGIDCTRVLPKLHFWESLRDHWQRVQLPDGGWGPSVKQAKSDLFSTTAGLLSLHACYQALNPKEYEACGNGPLPAPIVKAETWLDGRFRRPKRDAGNFGRMTWLLSELEALSGRGRFNGIDWHRHSVAQLVQGDGVLGGSIRQTARGLSFLASARRPVVFNKLRFDGDWNNRPLALPFAVNWMNTYTDWRCAWHVVGIDEPLSRWLAAPILYISGHDRPELSDAQLKKLRTYVCLGGTIFSVCEGESAGYTAWIREFCRKAFPGRELKPAAGDHVIFRKPNPAPSTVHILDNTVRPLVVHADEDIAAAWQKNAPASVTSYRLAVNVATYVTGGYGALHPRGVPYGTGAGKSAERVVRLLRIRHGGRYDPEPLAWDSFGRRLSRKTGVGLVARFVPPRALEAKHGNVAAMTGTGPLTIDAAGRETLKEYVSGGGTLLVDATGGDEAFYNDAKMLLEGLFGPAAAAGPDSRAVAGDLLGTVAYRPATEKRLALAKRPTDRAHLEVIAVDGREAVYLSREDITAGLLGFPSPSVDGYAPDAAFGITANVLNNPNFIEKKSELAAERGTGEPEVAATPGLWYCLIRGGETNRSPNTKKKVTIDMRETEDGHLPGGHSEVYTGYFYDEDGTVSFHENNDEHTLIRIDGRVVLHDKNWKNPSAKTVKLEPNPALPPGWHHYEMRFYNRTQDGGPHAGLAWGLDPDGGNNFRHPKDHPELRKLFAHELKAVGGDERPAAPPEAAGPTLTLDIGGGRTMEFVYIEPGTFAMGGESTTDDRFSCVETPKHEVTITKGFYLGTYEVTQAQFRAVMGKNPSKSTRAPDCPVDNTSWQDEHEFCKRVSQKTGRTVRLPTEAEWEYACRAGTGTDFGHEGGASALGEYAWIAENAGGKSHPVGRKKPNLWGLYDMHGNVCERVGDFYHRNYYKNSPKEDPTGPDGRFGNGNNGTTILRGGTWKGGADACRAGHRLRGGGYARYENWGFRCAVTVAGD